MFKVLLAVFSYAWITDPGPQATYPEPRETKQDTPHEKKEVLLTLDQYPEFKKLSARL